MKIAVTGGHSEAEFIISMFNMKRHELVVVNDDIQFAKKISEDNGVNVFYGDPAKPHILNDAGIKNSDILIALCDDDSDNYVICMLGKTMFNVKKCICIVKNPKNVDTFKRLGIDSVISSTYLLYQTILAESQLENIVKTLSFENERVMISEIVIKKDFKFVNQQIKDLKLPAKINISCVFREPEIIIPEGNTCILPGDKLMLVIKREDYEPVIEFFKQKVEIDG